MVESELTNLASTQRLIPRCIYRLIPLVALSAFG